MIENDNTSGRRWARFALVATLFVSVVANITHAVLADSEITLWLRVPGAAIWPILSFLAIEIIVRIVWRRTWAHALARLFILGPAVPAVIVSYEHQERLLRMMGESGIVQAIGPLAIDGLMIGCTLALLFTRPAPAAPASEPAAAEAEIEQPPAAAPVEAPVPTPAVERAPRAPRPPAADGARLTAVRALLAGATPKAAAIESGLSVQNVRKYGQAVRALREGLAVEVALSAGVVDMIRDEVRRSVI
jgi:hypothetical protein